MRRFSDAMIAAGIAEAHDFEIAAAAGTDFVSRRDMPMSKLCASDADARVACSPQKYIRAFSLYRRKRRAAMDTRSHGRHFRKFYFLAHDSHSKAPMLLRNAVPRQALSLIISPILFLAQI